MAEVSKFTVNDVTYSVRDRNFCTCSTAASASAKTATLDNFTLVTGAIVNVRFTYANTASSPTLNINSTGAKAIMQYGTTPAGTDETSSWCAGSVITFAYDGTYWIMSNFSERQNPTYTAGDGIEIDNYEISNTGVTSVAESSTDGSISVTTDGTTADVAVHGLGDLAFVDSLSKSDVGLGNVENTALSTWAGSSYLTTTSVGTLDNAAAKDVDTSISANSSSTNLPTSAAVATLVSEAIAASDAMIFKGTLGTDGDISSLPSTYSVGWTYRVVTAGTYAGKVCEIGDLVIALEDRSGSGTSDDDWTVAQTNIDGAITTAGTGLSKSGTTINHSNSITAGTAQGDASKTLDFDDTFTIPTVTYDAQGHITASGTTTMTMPSDPNTDTLNTAGSTDTASKIY